MKEDLINEETKNPMVRFNGFQVFEAETLIEATFLAVVDFLEWYSNWGEGNFVF